MLTVFTMAKNQLQLAQIIFHRKEIVDVTMLLSWLIPQNGFWNDRFSARRMSHNKCQVGETVCEE